MTSCTVYSDIKTEIIKPPQVKDTLLIDPGWENHPKPPDVPIGH